MSQQLNIPTSTNGITKESTNGKDVGADNVEKATRLNESESVKELDSSKLDEITWDTNIESASVNRNNGELSVSVSYENGVEQNIYQGPDNDKLSNEDIRGLLEGKTRSSGKRDFVFEVIHDGVPDNEELNQARVYRYNQYIEGDQPMLTFTGGKVKENDIKGIQRLAQQREQASQKVLEGELEEGVSLKAQQITKDSKIEGAFVNREKGMLSVGVNYDNGVVQEIYNGPDKFNQMADHQIIETLEGKSKQDAFRGFRKHVLFEGPDNPTMYSPDMDIEDYQSVMKEYTQGDKPALSFTQHDITETDMGGVMEAQEKGLNAVSPEELKIIKQADELASAQIAYEDKISSLQKAEENFSLVSKIDMGIEDLNTELGHRAQELGDKIGQIFDVGDKKEAYKALRLEHGKHGVWETIKENPEKVAPIKKEYQKSLWSRITNKENKKLNNALKELDKGFEKQWKGITNRKHLKAQLKGKKSVAFYKKKVKSLSKEVGKAEKSLKAAQKTLNKSVDKTLQKGGESAVKKLAENAPKVGVGAFANPKTAVVKTLQKAANTVMKNLQHTAER